MAQLEPLSPEWWLDRLYAQLVSRQADMQVLDGYYHGDHPLPFLTKSHQGKMRDEFRRMLEESRSNFMRLVIDATEERLRVDGFRLSAANDAAADEATWNIWQANQMDSESQVALVEALKKGVSYLSVWPGERDGDPPVMAVEDACQTIVGYEPGSGFRRRAAALKVWRDDWTGRDRANVYLPSGIWKYESTSSSPAGTATMSGARTFGSEQYPVRASGDAQGPSWKLVDARDAVVRNPFGVVPIVPLRNRPTLGLEGESELQDVTLIQNQINGFLFLLALAGYFGAHRQRWMTGVSLEVTPEGKPVEPFNIAIDRLVYSENPNATFGEFGQTDLSGYLSAIEQKVQHIAIASRTPKHYLLPTGQEPSGDAIKSAESGLIQKVLRKQRSFGEGFEEALRLARLMSGEGDSPVDSEVVWADAQTRTEAEVTDAAIKKFQAGVVPWQQAAEDMGYSQTQIARMLELFGGEAPSPVPPSPTPGPVQA